MSEALIGVIVGALIASIAPALSLYAEHRRWKRKTQLEHLRAERARLEQLFAKNLGMILEGMVDNSYDSTALSEIMVLMPKNVSLEFEKWMSEEDKDDEKARSAYLDISIEMSRSLAVVDKRIDGLVFPGGHKTQ